MIWVLADEQSKMNDCYFEKRDWRACKDEVRCTVIEIAPEVRRHAGATCIFSQQIVRFADQVANFVDGGIPSMLESSRE